jgi:hypothetical protein
MRHPWFFDPAPHGQAQRLCDWVLSMAHPGLLTAADIKGVAGASRVPLPDTNFLFFQQHSRS